MFKKDDIPLSYMRFFHALPIKYSIDIYIDTKLAFRDVLYEDFTDYVTLAPGEHTIDITHTKNPIIVYSTVWRVPKEKIYTTVIAPKTKDGLGIEVYKMEDTLRPIPSNNFLIRFGHFSLPSPSVDVFLADHAATFKKVSCRELTNYLSASPGLYNIEVKDCNNEKSLVTASRVRLKTSRFYSVYMIGNGTKSFPLKVTVPIDGNSYLKM